LENAPAEKAEIPLVALLDRFPPAPIQIAAIAALARLNAPSFPEVLLSRWRTVSPEGRRKILSSCLSQEKRTGPLLAAIETGRIAPGEVDALSRSALLRHADAAIQQRSVALWKEEHSSSRNEVIQKYRPALNLHGDASGGQNTFQRVCSTCHRLNGIGNEVGPNLALAATRSPDELLTAILDPNRAVDPAYVVFNVEMDDKETVSGLVVADNPAGVTLKGVSFTNTIPRQRIRKIASDGQSLMPVGLKQGLSEQDMADLLSFFIDSQYDLGTSGQSDSRDIPERR
jgi:putative heme-binding domain-containing protein